MDGNPINFTDPLGLKCNAHGCWNTPAEVKLANSGNYLGYYKLAASNGDNYAREAELVAENKGWQANFTNWNLRSALKHSGWNDCEVKAVMEDIRQDLAKARVSALSGATEEHPKVLTEADFSKFHNDVFFSYGAENEILPVFGGDFPLSNTFFHWCAAPSCKP